MPKSAKHVLVVEFADLKIGSAAERYRASMAEYLPKPLRTLYRGGRALAVNGLTSSNAAAIIEIKRQCHEKSDFGHTFALRGFFRTPGGIPLTGEKHQGSFIFPRDQVHSRHELDPAKVVVNLFDTGKILRCNNRCLPERSLIAHR